MKWTQILDAPWPEESKQKKERKFYAFFYVAMAMLLLTIINYLHLHFWVKWSIYLTAFSFFLYISLRTFFAIHKSFLLFSRWLGMTATIVAVALIYTKDAAYQNFIYASIIAYIPSFIYHFFLAKEVED